MNTRRRVFIRIEYLVEIKSRPEPAFFADWRCRRGRWGPPLVFGYFPQSRGVSVTSGGTVEEFPHVFLNINQKVSPPTGGLFIGGVDVSSIVRVLSVAQSPDQPARIELYLYVANGAVTLDGTQIYPRPPEGGDPGEQPDA